MNIMKTVSLASVLALVLAAPAVGQSSTTSPTTDVPPEVQAGPSQDSQTEELAPADDGGNTAAQEALPPDPAGVGDQGELTDTDTAADEGADDGMAPVTTPEGVIADQMAGQSLATEVIGRKIVNAEGKSLGEITDLLLDESDQVVGAVISVGGFLGLGSKPVAVPWEQIELLEQDGEQVARVAMTEDELAAAPTFRTRAEIERQAQDEAAAQQQQMEMQESTTPTAPAAPE